MFNLKQPFGASYSVLGDDVLSMKTALTKTGDYIAPKTGLTPWTDDAVFDGVRKFQKRNGLTVDGIAKPGGPTEATLKSALAVTTPPYQSSKLEPSIGSFTSRTLRPLPSPKSKQVPHPSTLEMAPEKPKGKLHTMEMRPEYRKPTPRYLSQVPPRDIPDLPRILTLIGSVGDKLSNQGRDIEAVKQTLALTGHYPNEPAKFTNPTPDEDLTWGIRRFQSEFGLKQDGLLHPRGETERKLNQIATPLIQKARHLSRNSENHPILEKIEAPAKLSPKERQRARHGDLRDDSTPETPTETTPKPDIQWEEKPAISGHRGDIQINTDGPFRVEYQSATLGGDGIYYTVDWYPLDENGKVIPQYRNPESFWTPNEYLQSGGSHAGLFFPKESTGDDFIPPFESKYGYRAIIRVPPQEAVHGNAVGVDMEFYPKSGGKISRATE